MMAGDGPPGYAVDSAKRTLAAHADDKTCAQCVPGRCWMLEWAAWCLVTSGERLTPEIRHLMTLAARRIVNDHWPRTVDGCWPCGLPDCEPMQVAAGWLTAVGDHFMPAAARTPSVAELRQITGM